MMKYKIGQLFDELPKKDHDNKKTELIKKLDTSRSTFNEWLKLSNKDRRDIPGLKLKVIADFFACDIKDLFNDEQPRKSLKANQRQISNRQKIK